jgi:Nif-specific regulatory protein
MLLALGCHERVLGDTSSAAQHLIQAVEAALQSTPALAGEATREVVSMPGLEASYRAELLRFLARGWREAGDALKADDLWSAARAALPAEAGETKTNWALEHALLLTHMVQYARAIELLEGLLNGEAATTITEAYRGRILSLMGWCRVRVGERDRGLDDMRTALSILPESVLEERTILQSRLGITLFLAGSTQEGADLLDGSLKLSQALGKPDIEARILGNLSLRSRIEGNLDRADGQARQAFEILSASGRLEQLPTALSNLLSLALDRCDWDSWNAYQRLLESASRKSGNPVALSRCFEGQASMGLLRGRVREALRALRMERKWLSPHLREEYFLYWRVHVAVVAAWLGETRRAFRLLRRTKERAAAASLPAIEAIASRYLSELELIRNRTSASRAYAEDALRLRGGDVAISVPAILTISRTALRDSNRVLLEECIRKSDSVLANDSSPTVGPLRTELAAYLELLDGHFNEAELLVEAAASSLRELDLSPREILMEWEIGLAMLAQKAPGARAHLTRAHEVAQRCGIHGWSFQIAEGLALVARDTEQTVASQEQLSDETRLLPRVIELLNSLLEFPTLLQRSLTMAAEAIGANRGFILLTGESDLDLRSVAQFGGVDDAARSSALEVSRTIVRRVTESGQPFLTDDAGSDPRLGSTQSLLDMAVRSLICVPLRTRERVIGTIYLESRSDGAQFSVADLDLVESFAGLIAVAIANGRLHDELKRSRERIVGQNLNLRREVSKRYAKPNVIGQSPELASVLSDVERVAVARASVLITGESGTGKELIAKMIHYASPRSDQICVSLNCAAFPDDLIESELFGIEDRAATNVKGRIGIFEQAHGGSLFLDEIGDMPISVQVKLLRVLQEREFVPIGGSKVKPVDFRLITATNQDLRELIAAGRFRDDLYFRIHHLAIHIPPLRERKIDILILAEHFLQRFCDENSRAVPQMSPAFKAVLLRSRWDGNVRELQNYVERIAVMSPEAVLEPIFLPRDLELTERTTNTQVPIEGPRVQGEVSTGGSHRNAVEEFERIRILYALNECQGNQRQAAASLGLKESTLRYSMRKLGISPPASVQTGRPKG